MATNREPIFTKTRISTVNWLDPDNADHSTQDAASIGVPVSLYTCNVTSGARIDQIRIKARGENEFDALVRFYILQGATPYLLFEETLPATPAENGSTPTAEVIKLSERSDLPIVELEQGQQLVAGVGVAGGAAHNGTMAGFDVYVMGGEYE